MSVTPWIPSVSQIKDGDEVRQSVINPILYQLVQRDQHLYELIQQINDKSVLQAFNVPIHPDEASEIDAGKLNVVYYAKDVNGEGLKRASVQFGFNSSKSIFTPSGSSYVFGITNSVTPTPAADLWTVGLVDLPFDIDDVNNGLIELDAPNTVETFEVGPYYLSRRTPGKITNNPGGIAVYVGYAISKRQFILAPNVDEFSQLYINYRYDVLDRPTAEPVLDGSDWTIPDSDMTRLGWVDVEWLQANNPSALASYLVPANAKYLYNIPADYDTDDADNAGDGSLTDFEKTSSTELGTLLPPHPSNFINLLVNGVRQIFYDENHPDGIYSIDDYGLWWYNSVDGNQPWSSDLPSGWEPADWPDEKGPEETRPRIFIEFAKINPELRLSIVSSLAPFFDNTNNTAASFSLVDKYSGVSSTVGDLLLKYNPQFSSDTVLASADHALVNFTYNVVTGAFTRTTAPMVSTIQGLPQGGVSVVETPADSGNWVVSLQTQGSSGQVSSIEPVDAARTFIGGSLHSGLELRVPTSDINTGFIGKIILPAKFPSNRSMNIVLQLVGYSNAAGGNVNLGFDFTYNVSTATNSAAPASVLTANSTVMTNAIVLNDTVVTGIVTPLPSNYKLNQMYVVKSNDILIPANKIGEDSIVNFKLIRRVAGSNPYPSTINVLGVYWTIS